MTDLRTAAQQALEALEEYQYRGAPFLACDGAVAALRAALAQEQAEPKPMHPELRKMWEEHFDRCFRAMPLPAQEQAEPVTWMQPKTVDAHARPDLGYETCSKDDYGAFPVYTAPPHCPNCASLEAQNTELDRKLAELERAHRIIESEIKVDSHQTLDAAMQQPRAMAQAYENGYNAGVAHEREACAQVCEQYELARSATAAIRARGEQP